MLVEVEEVVMVVEGEVVVEMVAVVEEGVVPFSRGVVQIGKHCKATHSSRQSSKAHHMRNE